MLAKPLMLKMLTKALVPKVLMKVMLVYILKICTKPLMLKF
jgi:hypothetical protein